MKEKDLEKKLSKKTQDLISGGVFCKICQKEIVYILRGKGSASEELRYQECDAQQISIITQNGQVMFGYKSHEH